MTDHRRQALRIATVTLVVCCVAMGVHLGITRPAPIEDYAAPVSSGSSGSFTRPPAGIVQAGATLYIPSYSDSSVRFTICTLTALASPDLAYTAGHCGQPGDPVFLAPNTSTMQIGTIVRTGPSERDLAVVQISPPAHRGATSRIDASPLTDAQPITAVGAATPLTSGVVLDTGVESFPLLGADGTQSGRTGRGVATSLCVAPGDSGAPVYARDGRSVIAAVIATEQQPEALGCRTFIAPLSWAGE